MSPETVLPAREPASTGSTGGQSSAVLPSDLMQDAMRRLGVASLVYGGVWAFYFFFANVVTPRISPSAPLDDAWPFPGNPVALAIILCSLLLFGYTRSSRCVPRFASTLGLLFGLILAAGIALVNQWIPNTQGVSWVAVLIVVHPTIVPSPPRRTLLFSMAAATMDPLGVLVASLRDVPLPPWQQILWFTLPNYVCAFVALVPATVIRGLGRQVTKARELGSYQLGELLGKGGMGEVYRATHRMLQRPAAIKLIRPEALQEGGKQDTAIRRFRKEAEAAASLHSPHTVALYDFGVTGDGTLYHVMELLTGMDLETLVKRFGPVPPARMIYLMRQACDSLGEAHRLGLIHRDVKPANLCACSVGTETDFVKVLDFGLVKTMRKDGVNDTLATVPGIATGTPAFMAPEVALGQPDIDHRLDIYALGCVAYWLLTGRYVFEAENSVKMMLEHVRSRPVPPSERTELPVPPDVDAVVLACLEKDREARPSTAEELATRLAACEVASDWSAARANQWWQVNAPHIAGAARASGSRTVQVVPG